MTKKALAQELKQVREDILHIGMLVEDALRDALVVLQECKEQQVKRTIENDVVIDRLRLTLEARVMRLFSQYRPIVGQDLYLLVASFTITRALERSGDGAVSIAKNTLQLPFEEGKPRVYSQLPLDAKGYVSEFSIIQGLLQLGAEVQRILHETMKAFAEGDVAAARYIIEEDDVVDVRYHMVRHDLMSTFKGMQALVAVRQDEKMLQRATYLLWMAHKLERISDHCTTICEQIIFMYVGK